MLKGIAKLDRKIVSLVSPLIILILILFDISNIIFLRLNGTIASGKMLGIGHLSQLMVLISRLMNHHPSPQNGSPISLEGQH